MVEHAPAAGIRVHAEQVYANCQKYIQARTLELDEARGQQPHEVRRFRSLSQPQRAWIAGADTFFIASAHPDWGVDASHRGGLPGFVTVTDETTLIWPDYAGNNMFQTLGNIAAYPFAGLLFVDFDRGATLHLTGKARILWDHAHPAGPQESSRAVEFRVTAGIEIEGTLPFLGKFMNYSRFNRAVG